MDGSVILECHLWMENPHPWMTSMMKTLDDGHGRSQKQEEIAANQMIPNTFKVTFCSEIAASPAAAVRTGKNEC